MLSTLVETTVDQYVMHPPNSVLSASPQKQVSLGSQGLAPHPWDSGPHLYAKQMYVAIVVSPLQSHAT